MSEISKASNSVNRNSRLLRLFLTPSWISALLSICAGLAVLTGVFFMAQYDGSSYQQQIYEARSSNKTVDLNNETVIIDDDLDEATLANSAPLLIIWSIVGLVVYMFAAGIVRAFQNAAELKTELDYVNVSRDNLLKQAFGHLALRIVIAATWIIFIVFFFNAILPYSIAAAKAASVEGILSLTGLSYALLSLLVMALGVHINAIMFRLLMFKPRVFSKALYIN